LLANFAPSLAGNSVTSLRSGHVQRNVVGLIGHVRRSRRTRAGRMFCGYAVLLGAILWFFTIRSLSA